MPVQLVVTGGHASKLFEATEEPLNGVSLGVAGRVVRPRVAPLAARRNHGHGAAGSQGSHQRVRIVAPVGNQVGRGQALEQGQGVRGIVALAGREAATHGPAAGVGHGVQLAAQPAAAASQGLRSVFLRAPAACWCARTVVESTSSVCRAASSCTASNTRCHTPEAAQRWKRV